MKTPMHQRAIADVTAHRCNTTDMAYIAAGRGEPAVVFIHGWNAFKEIWWPTLATLGRSTRVIAPDLPGHGQSPLGPARTMGSLAEQVATFCAAQGHDRVVLAGHSMGGNVAVHLALTRPELVSKLILVDPAIDTTRMPYFTRAFLDRAYGWAALRTAMVFSRSIGRLSYRVPHLHPGGIIRPALRRARFTSDDADALYVLLKEMHASPLVARLGEITMPTLVVSGQYDSLVPTAHTRAVAQAIPGATFTLIKRAGHNPQDERPEAFTRALLPFLGLAEGR